MFVLQDTYQTNGTGLRRDVGMPDFGNEFHFGWFKGVLFGHINVDRKHPSFVGCSAWTVYCSLKDPWIVGVYW